MRVDGQGRPEPDLSGEALRLVPEFHRFQRATLFWKCSGLSEDQLRWSPVSSGTCLLGILKHSLYVERYWIADVIGKLDVEFVWTKEDPDADWRIEEGDTLESITALYRAEAERTEQILASVAWDDLRKPKTWDESVSVGWIVTHMVEEVSRHVGHCDLIREMIDGAVGE